MAKLEIILKQGKTQSRIPLSVLCIKWSWILSQSMSWLLQTNVSFLQLLPCIFLEHLFIYHPPSKNRIQQYPLSMKQLIAKD